MSDESMLVKGYRDESEPAPVIKAVPHQPRESPVQGYKKAIASGVIMTFAALVAVICTLVAGVDGQPALAIATLICVAIACAGAVGVGHICPRMPLDTTLQDFVEVTEKALAVMDALRLALQTRVADPAGVGPQLAAVLRTLKQVDERTTALLVEGRTRRSPDEGQPQREGLP